VARLIVQRLLLSLITLFLLSVIIFAASQVLPGNVARSILGPLADPRAVDALNRELGLDRPYVTQYLDWITGFFAGDLGLSYSFRRPVAEFLLPALANSALLALVAFVMVVPLGIAGGVYAAMHAGRAPDRAITLFGLSATVVPEFVSGIILIIVFGVLLRWLPISATPPPGSGLFVQLYHLILPALPLVLVLFGYIARMARAGTIEALNADYTRTAVLKGLGWPAVLRRHVLPNALLPTIAVVATQVGYLIGGLVVVEVLFRYQGLGLLIFNAAKSKDFPMLQSGVLLIGVIYTLATLIADLLTYALNPRLRQARRA
jgi:peptide/nickel transport system permease protein